MPNPNQSKNFKPDCAAMMENDPLASIVECCHITHSAEEILGTCGFANEPVGPEDDSEELTQHEVHPIMMFTLSDTQSQGAADSDSSSSDAFCTAAETVPSTGADLDLVRDKDLSVPMDHEMAPEVVSEMEDTSSESETKTDNYRFVKRGAASGDPENSELRCGSSEPSVVMGQCKVQNVQGSANEDDDSKKVKFDVLNVLKEIVEHQKSSSSIPKRYAGLTFPRPRWWPENYEDIV